ncbi:MAG: HD domain-containing protein [Candidatus Shapirobacteria bacterium]
MNKKILYLIEQAGVLMNFPRSHKKHLGNTFDTVASHSHHVSIIAYCICRMEGLSHEDGLKAITMAVFHDLPEARTGDFDFVAKHYGVPNESKAVDDQFEGISFGEDLKKVINEYENRETLVAKCAKDADGLEQMYQEWFLMWQGNEMAKVWFESDFNDRVPHFKTESAKTLASQMKDSNPQEWWWSEFTENGSAKDLSKLIGK